MMIFLKLPLLLGAMMLAMMGSRVMAATSRPLRCLMYLTGYVTSRSLSSRVPLSEYLVTVYK